MQGIQLYVSVAVVLAICIVETIAAPVEVEFKENMSSAVKRGQTQFGGAISREPKHTSVVDPAVESTVEEKDLPVEKHIYSIDSAPYTSLGGGKPNRNDKYREHNYTPLAPKVLPWTSGQRYNPKFISPEEAAERYVPHHPYQFTTD